MAEFTHLHVHTQYSILDGASSIAGLLKTAAKKGMSSIAITDHGNMFGVKLFHKKAKELGVKPILGVEAYVAKNSRFDKNDKDDRSGDHLILLAKNYKGYQNLMKIVSYSWTEGFYYKPRIDKELLEKYNEGVIACSACLGGELPQALMNEGYEAGLKVANWFKSIFGEDYYMELQLHQAGDPRLDKEVFENQKRVNEDIVKISKETGIKYIASNDVHFINAKDADAHDLLICLNTGKDIDDPTRMRYTKQEYLKSPEEMSALFKNYPEAIETTQEIANKIEAYELNQKPFMPVFPLPEGFDDEMKYLRHVTYQGSLERWGENFTGEIKERVDFELDTMEKMGFPSYFLIVWDFIRAAREMGVSVGPGRGSAAGSAVAYALKITNIDPVKYDLLFERFLNPDRISMPDIDIDFDEDGREEVLKWVVKKYGDKRVAHIITFGTMAAKMAIKDVARVQKLPLPEADRLAKLVPEKPGTTLAKAFAEVPELNQERTSPNELVAKTLGFAETLEGSVRQTGIHACGIIIARDDLENYIPVSTHKDASLLVTQYDGKHVEDVGLLKMDFLGLKTLSIIKDALEYIEGSKGVVLDIEKIPLDDVETYELYARGDTTALFQFESPGMKKYLRALKPNRFEDLIAMNALYRPGPLEYIPDFIDRKHGRKKIEYDIAEMEEYLKDTYGITVYQEQVMLLSQSLAGFTKGQADTLRKAMGKKMKDVMDKLKADFIKGATERGHDAKILEKVWSDWEAFAQYAFNKSHSTCYAYVSYQTAYLKAHYPSEFMAAVLSRNLSDIKKITTFMDECRRMGIDVLGPDVNESNYKFAVNKKGQVRFGLGAVKGLGEGAVNAIIEERRKNGPYKDIYDLVERVNLSAMNRKNLETLVLAGGLDSLSDLPRSSYFATDAKDVTFVENLIRYGNRLQSEKNSAMNSLFGAMASAEIIQRPEPAPSREWSNLERLNKEREVVGIYLSSHPLDDYKIEIDNFTNSTLADFQDLAAINGKEFSVAGMVTTAKNLMTKTGKPYGMITVEDYTESYTFTLFGRDYEQFRTFFYEGYSLLIRGTVGPHPFRPGEFETKLRILRQLHNVRDEMVKGIQITLPIFSITEEIATEIKNYAETSKGNVALKVKIVDPADKISVEMHSRTYRVGLNNEFISYLQHNNINFRLID